MTRSQETFWRTSSPSTQDEVRVQQMRYPGYNLENEGKRLSVVVPVYNEEENIQNVVDDLQESLIPLLTDFEIILVDDGSTDRTLDVAHSLQRAYPNVNLLIHETNRGKTAAMVTGFNHADGDYIVLMDGDGQFLAKDIPKMIKKLEKGCDVVNGWGKKRESFTKIIPSLIYNGISRKLFSLSVHQFNLGFKAFKRKAVEGLVLKKDEHRYILPLLKEKGFIIEEVPVEYLPRLNGTSKYGVMRIPLGVMDMISLKIEMLLGERPFRVFGLASLGLIVPSILLGLHAVYGWISGNGTNMWSIAFGTMFLLSGITLLFVGYAVEAVKSPRR